MYLQDMKQKVELQYKLCVAFLVMLFLETFIVVSVSYREKKNTK